MKKQVLVVGLGRFGMSVARALAERSVDVLVVDSSSDRVDAAAGFAAEAACFDATQSKALARISPERRDVCVCAIGDDSVESSILCTALLREMGAKRVIARAAGDLQARILKRVGAHEVVNPLRDYGSRLASRLVHHQILGELPLGDDLVITELAPTEAMQGKNLAELDLRRRHGILVVAVRAEKDGAVRLPEPEDAIGPEDVLIVVSRPDAVPRLMERE